MIPVLVLLGCLAKLEVPLGDCVPSDWYADADGDGFGDGATEAIACEPPSGFVVDGTDCDDANPAVHPDADEICDTLDNDCDSLVEGQDDSLVDAPTWYADNDGDGYGGEATADRACQAPSGTLAQSDDCDDTDASVHPDAEEVCDELDNDCDGLIDTQDDAADGGVVDAATWYTDADADRYGDPDAAQQGCEAPSGTVANDADCDDGEADVNPGASEVCDGLDNDCDGLRDGQDDGVEGAPTWYTDSDGDGYGDPGSTQTGCSEPPGAVASDDDCDDGAYSVNPGASEVCDGVDNDCDGLRDGRDDSVVDAATWYTDDDGDGFGDPASTQIGCGEPPGAVASDDDCDDGDRAVNPDATETCDGADNDCDGLLDADDDSVVEDTFYEDSDGDGFGNAAVMATGCSAPSGYVATGTDCDDTDPAVGSCYPVDCADALAQDPTAASGVWSIDPDGDGVATDVTCDMDTDGGGWTVIVDEDYATDSCPSGWTENSAEGLCAGAFADGGAQSAVWSTLGVSWAEAQVSVAVRQYASTDGFKTFTRLLEENYVDGVSVTRGDAGAREHIWSFAVGQSSGSDPQTCPDHGGWTAPSFAGSNWSCDTGNPSSGYSNVWYTPELFDGEIDQATLATASIDDLEVRILADQGAADEDVGVVRLFLAVR